MKQIFRHTVCETLDEVLDPSGCALVLIDLQNDAMRPNGKLALAGNDVSAMLEILPRCSLLLDQARTAGIKVVHVMTLTLREGRSDSPSWIRTKKSVVNASDFFLEGTWGAEICDEVAPIQGEPVVVKHRSSAFVGTNLDLLLKAGGVRTVVIASEQTPGCVEATFRAAAYHDFYSVLIADCVAAFDRELHDASLAVQMRRHDVTTSDAAVAIWRRALASQGAGRPRARRMAQPAT